MKKQQKILIGGGGLLLVLLMTMGGGEDQKNYWNDKMIPAVQVRCLSEVDGLSAELLAKQKFCTCLTDRFKKNWKQDEAFQNQLRPVVSGYFGLEDSMKSSDRNQAILLVESDISAFYKDLLGKMGMKWSGARFEKKEKAIEEVIEPLYESSKRKCAHPK